MKCPKCGNEPTLAEVQRSPGDCLKCGISYEGYASSKSKGAEARSGSGLKFPFLLLILLVVSGIGYGGYEGILYYERQQFIRSAENYVRGTTVHLQQMIDTQKNPGAITFQELFNKSAKSIEEIDGFIVQVSMLDGQPDIKESVIAYMKASQDVLRGVAGNWRGILAFSTAKDRVESARKRYLETTNEYVSEYAKKAWDEAIEDTEKALMKAQEATANYNAALARARDASGALIWFAEDSKPTEDLLKDI